MNLFQHIFKALLFRSTEKRHLLIVTRIIKIESINLTKQPLKTEQKFRCPILFDEQFINKIIHTWYSEYRSFVEKLGKLLSI